MADLKGKDVMKNFLECLEAFDALKPASVRSKFLDEVCLDGIALLGTVNVS